MHTIMPNHANMHGMHTQPKPSDFTRNTVLIHNTPSIHGNLPQNKQAHLWPIPHMQHGNGMVCVCACVWALVAQFLTGKKFQFSPPVACKALLSPRRSGFCAWIWRGFPVRWLTWLHTASVLRHLFTLGTFTAYTHEIEPRDTVSVFTERTMALPELKPNWMFSKSIELFIEDRAFPPSV
jgi:hypothetical protein